MTQTQITYINFIHKYNNNLLVKNQIFNKLK